MLLDILTLTMILNARNGIAAKQFLTGLTCQAHDFEYSKVVVLKAVALSGEGAKEWLEGVY